MTAVQSPPTPPATTPPPRTPWPVALLRNSWRQLTSMRTALVLLFLLAVAAIPGSILPQRNVAVEKVTRYFTEHPDLAPALDRVWAFDVYGSPWFSAIYLLLFVSLVGCIVPRLRDHTRALRAQPPDAPRHLDRLPHYRQLSDGLSASDLHAMLRKKRWRVVTRTAADGMVTVSAEKGHLKETGNLLFHYSLVAVLIGVAVGSWWGWHANRLLVAGPEKAFCNSLQQYDEYGLGARIDGAALPPFCLELRNFTATYRDTGQPANYAATVAVTGVGDRVSTFSVNHPLRLDRANVYLLGHGYAPVLKYTDRFGQTQTVISPFLAKDAMLTSEGVAAFPDTNVDPKTGARDRNLQVAFEGVYLPTVPDQPPLTASAFPAERSPGIMLWAYRGDLGLDAGIPGSVYSLDRRQIANGQLKRLEPTPHLMRPGDTWTLDDGTKLEFVGTRQYATLSIRYDPGEKIVLVGVAVLVGGLMLSLAGRRRRIWYRFTTSGSNISVEAGGLARSDHPGFAAEFAALTAEPSTAEPSERTE